MERKEPTVETRRGWVRGTVEGDVRVFRGIPFAKPPVGPLRFGAPEPPEPWRDVRDATRFGPASHQANRPLAPILGILVDEESEDCLTLNVWTPAAGDGGRRPVMVWIHGGRLGHRLGIGTDLRCRAPRPTRRRGRRHHQLPPGTLRLPPRRGSSAAGSTPPATRACWIMVAALEWVRDEIAAFGGDPGNVTVFGESAGSVNIACLLTMPRARGLFHRAVLQSGSLNLTRPPSTALDVTRQILAEVGLAPADAPPSRCPGQGPHGRGQRRGRPLRGPAVLAGGRWRADSRRPFAAIAAGSARGVPLIVGTNLEEMKLYRFLDPALEKLDAAGLVARCNALSRRGSRRTAQRRAGRGGLSLRRGAARGEDTSPAETWLAISTDHIFRAGALKLAAAPRRHTPDGLRLSVRVEGEGARQAAGRGARARAAVRLRHARRLGDRRSRRPVTPAAATLCPSTCRTPGSASPAAGAREPRGFRTGRPTPRPAGPP